MHKDFTLKNRTKAVLYDYGVRPSMGLGQNFLIDRQVLGKIIKVADLGSSDLVVEIGPGIGNLTRELAGRAKKVIAVEKDPSLARILNDEFRIKNIKNVKVVKGDILKIPHSTFHLPHSYKVVANLPFYLVAPLTRRFLEAKFPPQVMVLVVQKEVAQRICSRPPEMNLLAVSVQFYAEPKIVSYVSRKSFWPEPKVDAAIIKVSGIRYKVLSIDKDLFFKIVRAGFSQPRKQLANNLTKNLKLNTRAVAKGGKEDLSSLTKTKVINWLKKNKIRPSQRAETLKIRDWLNLSRSLPF
jgi:16S rRNA (adenine1518-N6/adenine1519-N6)-dimethyltransferase